MNLHINYISNSKGIPNAVIIPINEWNKILNEINIKIEDSEPSNEKILKGIQEAIKEVKLIKSGKKKQKSLNEFLNEL